MGESAKLSSMFCSDNNNNILSNSEFLSRQAVLNRRLYRVKKLARVYRDHYWALVEDLKTKHREYYWKYGKSPFKEGDEEAGRENNQREIRVEAVVNSVNNGNNCEHLNSSGGNLGLSTGDSFYWCAFPQCKSKAMALTKYCFQHILEDKQQKLYKRCNFVVTRVHTRPICCDKPILRSTVPSLCPIHLQKTEKQYTMALKKAGLNAASSTKFARKFHVVVSEFVRQIQSKRKVAFKDKRDNTAVGMKVGRSV